MKVALLTREFPPDVYGGAGVHVEYLARELARLIDVEVLCFGDDRPGARAFRPWPEATNGGAALGTISVDVAMAADIGGADVVHSHTWYANLGGHLAKLLHGVPHVLSTHSLEPSRPWKAEQLGAGGYALSSWCERTAIEAADGVIAVSSAMRGDVLQHYPAVEEGRIAVIHNGIDADQYGVADQPDGAARPDGRVGDLGDAHAEAAHGGIRHRRCDAAHRDGRQRRDRQEHEREQRKSSPPPHDAVDSSAFRCPPADQAPGWAG